MTTFQKVSLLILRIGLGWVYFWAGLSKIMTPGWSAAGYLNSAKNFPALYHFFASPGLLPVTNIVNEWGLLLLGASLILGIGIRWSAPFGILLMVLYYFALPIPHPDINSLLVDEHGVYVAALLVLVAFRADRFWVLGRRA